MTSTRANPENPADDKRPGSAGVGVSGFVKSGVLISTIAAANEGPNRKGFRNQRPNAGKQRSLVTSPFPSFSPTLCDSVPSDLNTNTKTPIRLPKPKLLTKAMKRRIAICRPVRAVVWGRLTTLDRLKRTMEAMAHPTAITIQFSEDVLAEAAKHQDPVDWARRRITRALEKVFGKGNVLLTVVAEPNRNRPGFHFHGVLDVSPDMRPAVSKALRKACGAWNVSGRQFQFKFDDQVSYCWADYMLKDGTLARAPYISPALRDAAQVHHSLDVAKRKAKALARRKSAVTPSGGPRTLFNLVLNGAFDHVDIETTENERQIERESPNCLRIGRNMVTDGKGDGVLDIVHVIPTSSVVEPIVGYPANEQSSGSTMPRHDSGKPVEGVRPFRASLRPRARPRPPAVPAVSLTISGLPLHDPRMRKHFA
ncbi:hypothetical protein [Aestuariivirga sp.]|uniref:hypothetical protein n=1 Tax=Aestuariivirga sp. TaxID=2650926 RepID=UPI003BA97462